MALNTSFSPNKYLYVTKEVITVKIFYLNLIIKSYENNFNSLIDVVNSISCCEL